MLSASIYSIYGYQKQIVQEMKKFQKNLFSLVAAIDKDSFRDLEDSSGSSESASSALSCWILKR